MQVKKYEASSVIEALKEVKRDLGPEAIILSTQEAKKSLSGSKTFIVMAAVKEDQLRKKEMAEKYLEDIYKTKVQGQSAIKQKLFIENVYKEVERKHKAVHKKITATPYIDIEDHPELTSSSKDSQESPRKEVLVQPALPQVLQEKQNRSEALGQMLRRLKSLGVSNELCFSLERDCGRELGQGIQRPALVESWFAKRIMAQTQVAGETKQKVELYVGPRGAGKTSTLVKQATQYVMQENKRLAIMTSDLNKVGGVEELRVYSRILNVPVFVLSDLKKIEQKIEGLDQWDKVLVDTPGVSLSSLEELDAMRAIAQLKLKTDMKTHLVISALTKEKDIGGLLKRFRVSGFDDIVVTNIDQTSQHGILLNIQDKIQKPFHSFGIGSDIVDGFERASRERVLDLIFKLTKKIGERGNETSL